MNSRHQLIRYGFVACLISALLPMAAVQADEQENAHKGSRVSIAASGQVIVRDARIVAISGNTITAKTGWGDASLLWIVERIGATQIAPSGDDDDVMRSMKIGQTIDFSGRLRTESNRFIVEALTIKNTSLVKAMAIVSGTITEVSDADQRLVIFNIDTGTTTVLVDRGTIMTLDGDTTYFSRLEVGDVIKVQGTLNTVTKTMRAGRISLASTLSAYTPGIPNTGSKKGLFLSMLEWLRVGQVLAASVRS